jgi:hypothetical protein
VKKSSSDFCVVAGAMLETSSKESAEYVVPRRQAAYVDVVGGHRGRGRS